jgi:CheY-like chemotaxis protein
MMSPLNVADWNVLLVDDEPDNLSVLELLLTFYDAHVTSVRSGQEAIKALSARAYTLALVDIQMPLVSGWDVIKHIRESEKPAVRSMLCIAVTAYAMAGDRERVLQAGFDGYVPKPIDVTTFMQSLQETVEARQAADQARSQKATAASPDTDPQPKAPGIPEPKSPGTSSDGAHPTPLPEHQEPKSVLAIPDSGQTSRILGAQAPKP